MPDAPMSFAQLLDRHLRERYPSDVEPARILGVSVPTVNRWRNGLQVPTDDRIPPLARFLGVDEDTVARSMRTSRTLKRESPDADAIIKMLWYYADLQGIRQHAAQGDFLAEEILTKYERYANQNGEANA